MDVENENLKKENNDIKWLNKTLKEKIQKFKEGDMKQAKEETDNLKKVIADLEKKNNEMNIKYQNISSEFNHDFGISKKIRLILNYLVNNNKVLETKLNEYNIYKEKSQIKEAQLQQMLNDKNIQIETKDKLIEENKKKLLEEKVKYSQLNNEFINLTKLSKEEQKNDGNEGDRIQAIKNSFSDLSKLMNQYKEILPFLYDKLESLEKENNNLKEQLNKINKDNSLNINETVKMKEKEIEELKTQIKQLNSKNDNLIKEQNKLKTENVLIKDDIKIIGNSLNKKEINIEINNISEENSLNEILNQLIKARNIISFLLNEK